MGNGLDLTSVQWRKSSYSGTTGGDCVECAPLGAAAQPCLVAVRDSKNPGGPAFTVSPGAFTTFVRALSV
ncbi:DUF397 domain-containing protein [Streptomyces sp. NPDC060031]|uniref:DUF397 domain-containing protein n=1 Tax=Streptomyces sp. NPDC060031 TaxID=3347043 RepID=UPI0036BD9D87